MNIDPIEETRRLLAARTPVAYEVTYWPANANQRCGHNDMIAVDLDIDWSPGGPSITKADAEFIAAAPRLLAALCDRLEAAERRVTAMQGSLEAAACDFEGAETDMRCVIDFIDRDGRLDKALSHARAAIYDYEDARKACRKAAE